MSEKLSLKLEMNPTINYALFQNYVPVVRSIRIHNNTAETLTDLKLVLSFDPGFAKEYSLSGITVPAMEEYEKSPVAIQMDTEFLLSQTERVRGYIRAEIYSGTEVLLCETYETEVLAFDEWPGISLMPEVTATFVTPNDPAIMPLINKTGEYLRTWTGTPSLPGYEYDSSEHVFKQVAAVYNAIKSENIAYIVPPASFEESGQRVRMAQAVMRDHRGTCLDLAFLFLSVLEAIGLNGILMIFKGHAFIGCHLVDTCFGEPVTDDITMVTKRFASGINDLCVVECTDMTAGKDISFEMAVQHAKSHFAKPENFYMAIDIMRCHSGKIRPLSLEPIKGEEIDPTTGFPMRPDYKHVAAPSALPDDRAIITEDKGPKTRQEMWERKLLDLSLRNALLSFRIGHSGVKLLVNELDKFEDKLSAKGNFKILCKPTELEGSIVDEETFLEANSNSRLDEIADAEFANKRIRTLLTDNELEKVLTKLYRGARHSEEENSVSTLYLALGFLKWKDDNGKERYAPLILIPVELVRKNISKSYEIRMRDEEPQMNITLLEMLRQNYNISIGGLDPLPQDDCGVDVRLVFNSIRRAVLEKEGWDVVEMCYLGQFSFARFIMWNDIRNRAEDLQKNKVVASLIEGRMLWEPETDIPTLETLDAVMNPAETAVPLSVDSSQLLAVCSAAKGQSFVLHGPPGTGKSQTITNMIANALYQDKTVLFVAEKKAALSVVEKRLSKIGLAPFCLELHSNKAQKRAVLDQFAETLEIGRRKAPEDYTEAAGKLHELRQSLNAMVSELHKKRYYGLSLYEVISLYEQNSEYKGRAAFSMETVSRIGAASMEEMTALVKRLSVAASECEDIATSPLRLVECETYYPGLREELSIAASEYRLAALNLQNSAEICAEQLGIMSTSEIGLRLTEGLIALLKDAEYLLPSVFDDNNLPMHDADIRRIIDTGIRAGAEAGEISAYFDYAGVMSLDVNKLIATLNEAQTKGFFTRNSMKSSVVDSLRRYAKNKNAVTKDNAGVYLNKIAQLKADLSVFAAIPEPVVAALGIAGKPSVNYNTLKTAYEKSAEIWNFVTGAVSDASEYDSIFARMKEIALSPKTFMADNAIVFNMFTSAYAGYKAQEEVFLGKYRVRVDYLKNRPNFLASAAAYAEEVTGGCAYLRQHVSLMNVIFEAEKTGIKEYTDLFRAGKLSTEELVPVFVCNLSLALAKYTIAESEILRVFDGPMFEQTIADYKNALTRFETCTVQELVALLSAKIPASGASIAGSSELNLLLKAIKNGGRGTGIRKLFDEIPTLLRRLKPCMLMSPLSVAQYIDPNYPKFDLIIFDEASQLPTSEAVGAIARANNCIVVGDPKQLPPTTFFMNQSNTDEEDTAKEDLESLLDDCLALSMPEEHLLWHYRSRHESLIAYSNSKYYDHKLYTFPSPDNMQSKVSLVHVDGFYDRSASKQNRAEGEAVVKEIVRRLKDENLRKYSIGVVTFSMPQQTLIEDLFLDELSKDPELDRIAGELEEPVFVKNLENVQGDERDVILFSIGYGPDKEGKVTVNFGPVNRDGGWRRLNVAITRSRVEMIVFATLRPEQIDLSKTMSEGVAGLKGFLEFAEKGTQVLARAEYADPSKAFGAKKENGIIKKLAEDIAGLGYETDICIGSSEYKLDIGVRNPKKEGTYMLGILCDGPTYAQSYTARDRNLSQPGVLEGLGWNLMHVWTLDYLDNPERVLARVEENLAVLMKGGSIKEVVPHTKAGIISFERAEETESPYRKPYLKAQLATTATGAAIYEPEAIDKLVADINEVILREAPVNRKYLYKRVLAAWQISRLTDKSRAMLDDLTMRMRIRYTTTNGEDYFWRIDQQPATYATYRVPVDEDTVRSLDEICTEEISVAVMEVVRSQISLTREDLAREVGKIFGFTRIGDTIVSSVNSAIELCMSRGVLKETDGRISEVIS